MNIREKNCRLDYRPFLDEKYYVVAGLEVSTLGLYLRLRWQAHEISADDGVKAPNPKLPGPPVLIACSSQSEYFWSNTRGPWPWDGMRLQAYSMFCLIGIPSVTGRRLDYLIQGRIVEHEVRRTLEDRCTDVSLSVHDKDAARDRDTLTALLVLDQIFRDLRNMHDILL